MPSDTKNEKMVHMLALKPEQFLRRRHELLKTSETGSKCSRLDNSFKVSKKNEIRRLNVRLYNNKKKSRQHTSQIDYLGSDYPLK